MELLHHKKLTATNGINTGVPAIRGVREPLTDSHGGALNGAPKVAEVPHDRSHGIGILPGQISAVWSINGGAAGETCPADTADVTH